MTLEDKVETPEVVEEEEEKKEEEVVEKPKKTRAKKAKDGEVKVKKTREPTFYNIFTKRHVVSVNEAGRGMYAKAMGELWRESEEGQFFSERCAEVKKENKEKSNLEIYNLVEKEWQEYVVNKEEKSSVEDFELGEA